MATTKRKLVVVDSPSKPARVDRTKESNAKSIRKRVKVDDDSIQPASSYFADVNQKDGLQFIKAGAAVMDSALGGGWVLGRIANIVSLKPY